MEVNKKLDTGCLLDTQFDYKPMLEEVNITRGGTDYYYRIDEREKNYFLAKMLQKYRYFQVMLQDDDLKCSFAPLLYQLLGTHISMELLKMYLQNKLIEELEFKMEREDFVCDKNILYDAHISYPIKKSLIYDYLSLCMKYTDVFHRMVLERMMEEIGLDFDTTSYQKHFVSNSQFR